MCNRDYVISELYLYTFACNLCTHVAYNTVCVVDYGVFILISDFHGHCRYTYNKY